MSSLPANRANTLKAAFRVCDVAPLVSSRDIERYYVNLSKVRKTEATREHEKVTADDITYAIKQEQFNFERSISTEYYSALAAVYVNKDVSKDEIGRLMLFSLWVFEYKGKNRWNYVNPVVRQIHAFQEAVKSATSNS